MVWFFFILALVGAWFIVKSCREGKLTEDMSEMMSDGKNTIEKLVTNSEDNDGEKSYIKKIRDIIQNKKNDKK